MRHMTARRAFSLIEISIVLAVISLVLAGLLPMIVESTRATDSRTTLERMDAIEEALSAYVYAYGRLPCPANNTAAITSTNFGAETGDADGDTDCSEGSLDANWQSGTGATDVAYGGVPTRALNLPDEYGLDGWGRRLNYMVSVSNLDDTALASLDDGAITINPSRTTKASYALWSSGENGHGGYTIGGGRYNAGVTNTNELDNCACNSSAAAATQDATLVMQIHTGQGASAFDDIMRYKTKEQLQIAAGGISSSGGSGNVPAKGFVVEGSTTNLPHAAYADVTFSGTPDSDFPSSAWNNTTFTVPAGEDGWYAISAAIQIGGTANLKPGIIVSNSAGSDCAHRQVTTDSGTSRVNVSCVRRLSAGTTLKVMGAQFRGSSYAISTAVLSLVKVADNGGGGVVKGIIAKTTGNSLANDTTVQINSYNNMVRNDFGSSTFSGGVFTVPSEEAGWYQISGYGNLGNQYADLLVYLVVNGAAVATQRDVGDADTSHSHVNPSIAYYLSGGDTVYMSMNQQSGATRSLLNGTLSIVKIANNGGTGAETDPQVTTLDAGDWCRANSSGTAIECDQNPPTLTESDPQVGSLTNGRWCRSNGSQVICDRTPISGYQGRTLNATYTASTPGFVVAYGYCYSSSAYLRYQGYVGSTVVVSESCSGRPHGNDSRSSISYPVPAGSTYRVHRDVDIGSTGVTVRWVPMQ